MSVTISNLKEEVKIVYADKILIDVDLGDENTEKLRDFIEHMPTGSQVPFTVRLRASANLDLKVTGGLFRDQLVIETPLVKKRWWDKYL